MYILSKFRGLVKTCVVADLLSSFLEKLHYISELVKCNVTLILPQTH